VKVCCLLLLACSPCAAQSLSFAVLTDIQYGDQPTAGKRDYRASLGKLQQAVAALNARQDLAFAIQLGDLIDSRAADLDPILAEYNRLSVPHRHVLGNHDFSAPRATLLQRLEMPAAWYDFTAPGYRFLVLDGMDLSVNRNSRAQGAAQSDLALAMFDSLRTAKAVNANDWNGAVSQTQLDWLRQRLKLAAVNRERVIAFCHFPVLREASTPAHLLWNHEAVRRILDSEPAVIAWFNGHDHSGGYAAAGGIHHVTFPGMVESGAQNSYSLVRLDAARINIEGTGTATSRSLPIAANVARPLP